MSYWHRKFRKTVNAPDVDAFIEEVIAVCRKHNMAIGHEDGHGSFIIIRGGNEDDWLQHADVEEETPS